MNAPSPSSADPKKTWLVKDWKHVRPLIACRFDPQGRYVFAGSQDNSVQRWDLKTGKQAALTAHDSWVRTIVFDRKAQTTITGGYDGRLIWWETASESPKPLKTQIAHAGWLRQAVVSPDGKLLVTVGDDKLVKLWSLPEGKLVKALPGHQKFVYSVLFHPSGKELVSADLSGVNLLLTGDLQTVSLAQDNLVDIVDFSALASRWNQLVNPDSELGADVNGDGTQGLADFTAMQLNFFEVGDSDNACASRPSRGGGTDRFTALSAGVSRRSREREVRLSVRVESLPFAGRWHADLTGDGMVDGDDIRAFARQNGLTLLPAFQRKLARLESVKARGVRRR